jgi:hypothetical protein
VIDNWLKNGTVIKTPKLDVVSRTPPKRPYHFLTSFKKHIPRSRPKLKLSADSFSTHEIDHVSTRNSSPTHMIHQDSIKPSDELSAPINENVLDISRCSKENNSRKLSDKGLSLKSK